jgi:hypothetical protein
LVKITPKTAQGAKNFYDGYIYQQDAEDVNRKYQNQHVQSQSPASQKIFWKSLLSFQVMVYNENYLSLIFRKINYFVQRLILDHKSVDFTILVVNFTIFYC